MNKNAVIIFSWFVRYGAVILLFTVFPIVILIIAKNYERKAMGIIDVPTSIDQPVTDSVQEVHILSQEQADTLQNINYTIVGNWQNNQDSKYILIMKPNNTFDELYDSKRLGYGSWRAFSATSSTTPSLAVASSSPGSLSSSMALSSDQSSFSYYIQKDQQDADAKGQTYIYQIYSLNSGELTLIRLDSDKIVSFVRATNTPSVVSPSVATTTDFQSTP